MGWEEGEEREAMSDALEGMPCGEIAIGEIIRPDGYRCRLCEHHQGLDWKTRNESIGPWTVTRYPILQRGEASCQRVVQEGKIVPKRPPLCGVCGLGLGVMLDYPPPMDTWHRLSCGRIRERLG